MYISVYCHQNIISKRSNVSYYLQSGKLMSDSTNQIFVSRIGKIPDVDSGYIICMKCNNIINVIRRGDPGFFLSPCVDCFTRSVLKDRDEEDIQPKKC